MEILPKKIKNRLNAIYSTTGAGKVRPARHFMRHTGTYENINSYGESRRRPFFHSSALNVSEKKDMCGHIDFFSFSPIFSGKSRTYADELIFFSLFQAMRPSASKFFQMRPFV